MEQQTSRSIQGEAATARKWKLDPAHSTVGFSARHMMITRVRGRFMHAEGELMIPPGESIPVSATAEIEVQSIDTREPKRDEHLRSADFFDAQKFPRIEFRSTRITPKGEDRFIVDGDLTIRGTTKTVTFEARVEGHGKDPWGNERIGYSASFPIKRSEFGMTYNQALETGGFLIGDEIEIELDGQAVPAYGDHVPA